MTELLLERRSPLRLIVAIVTLSFLVLCLAYFHFHTNGDKKPLTVAVPPIPVVSVCKELASGMKRIGASPGDRYMLQFDIPVNEVRVHEGAADMPPFEYGFGIRPQAGGESLLRITYGPQQNSMDVDRRRASSVRIVKRIIVDGQGRSVGEDDWGYPDPEKRWRRARFQGWVEAEYGFVNKKDADLFDQVINSACLLPGPG
jgi:hypothetical protein